MFLVEPDGTIKLTRGDTARFTVPIVNVMNKGQYVLDPGDTLTFTVKKSVQDATPSFQKILTGTNAFHIEPKDTAGMEFGGYKYDVQLTTVLGDVYTVIEPHVFFVLPEVTW